MEIIRRDQVPVLAMADVTSPPFEYIAVTAPPIDFRDAYAAANARKPQP